MLKAKSSLRRERYTWKGREIGELVHLGEKEDLGGGVPFYAIVRIRPGEAVGYHEHRDETEIFHILEGEGEINDNGTVVPVETGDIVVTPANGGHAFRNTGAGDFSFTALIMRDSTPG